MPDNRDAVPSAAWFGQLRAYLARSGLTPQQVSAVIGTSVGGRSRREIAESLTAALRALSD